MWRGCGVFLLLGMIGAVLLLAEWQAQAAERDARAPMAVVMGEDMSICRLSANGQFLFIGSPSGVQFYDLIQKQRVNLSLGSILSGPGGSFWLPDNRYFVFHTWREEYDDQRRIRIPTDGYVIDLALGMITDTLTLPAAEQEAILRLARAQSAAVSRNSNHNFSPDGQYAYWDFFSQSATIHYRTGASNDSQAVLNKVSGAIEACVPGWRTDSTGYYFIDYGGLFPSPMVIRLLLTHPPFPLWLWIWRAIGITLSIAIVGAAWFLRPP